MRPSRCSVCDRDFLPRRGGDLAQFADYDPLPPGATGQPPGLLWFGDHHLPVAGALSDRSAKEALVLLTTGGGSGA